MARTSDDNPYGKDYLQAVKLLLRYVGESPEREGLRETPERVLRSLNELTYGYALDPASVFKTFEDGSCDEMVVLKDIEFCSMCEHHMLPFTGVAHIGYIPNGRIIGISKLARLVEIFSRRLQVQERLTEQITQALDLHLNPLGSACVMEATHSCMSCRGVKKRATMITSSLTGEFRKDRAARAEFLMFAVGGNHA